MFIWYHWHTIIVFINILSFFLCAYIVFIHFYFKFSLVYQVILVYQVNLNEILIEHFIILTFI